MARQRRGGFKTPELRGTLGTLLRTTREVLERGAREGKSRVEEALAGRRRGDALAELGEIVLDLIRRGEIDVDELPEVKDVVAHLDELDAGSADEEPVARAPIRRRFDARASEDAEDGTVSAKTWAPPTRKKPAPTNVWRPHATKDASRPPDDATARERPAVRRAETIPGRKQPTRGGGGITFDHDDDSDLADYMHPDDVPPKTAEESDKPKDKKPPEGDS